MDASPASGEQVRRRLRDRGFAYLRVSGSSMLPALLPGEFVRLEPLVSLRPGSIVTFVLRDTLVTHRLLGVHGDVVTLCGDNRVFADPPVPVAALVGVVAEVVGRGPVDESPAALAAARRRRIRRRAARSADRLAAAAVTLLGGGGRYERLAPAIDAVAAGLPEDLAGGGWGVLTSDDVVVGPPLRLVRLEEGGVAVPAGVYSRLTAARRHELVACLAGREVAIAGWALAGAGRLVKATAAARRLAARGGLRAGEPGEALVPVTGRGRWAYVRYFSPCDLGSELTGMGVVVEGLAVRVTSAGMVVVARGRCRSRG